LQALANLGLAGMRMALQEIDGGQDHAWCAEAALESVLLPKGVLERVKLPGHCQALDRLHASAVGLHSQNSAGLDRLAVDEDGAGAALAGVAAHVGAGQPEHIAQVVDK